MKIRAATIWETLRLSFWFVPGVMAVGGVGLAVGAFAAERWMVPGTPGGGAIVHFKADAAREMLSTITAATISVAGVVFSITILVLSSASTNYGPRLLRNFMDHTGTKLVLGAFIAVFIYSLITLSLIQDDDVPQLSLLLGLSLGIISFLVLIYVVHHVADFIYVPRILDDAASRLQKSMEQTFPARKKDAEAASGKDDSRLRLVPPSTDAVRRSITHPVSGPEVSRNTGIRRKR